MNIKRCYGWMEVINFDVVIIITVCNSSASSVPKEGGGLNGKSEWEREQKIVNRKNDPLVHILRNQQTRKKKCLLSKI